MALDWTALPNPVVTGSAVRYTPVMYGLAGSTGAAIPALTTTEGTYTVNFRVRDELGRVSNQTRCWQHRLLPPALNNGTPYPTTPTQPLGMFPIALNRTTLGTATATLLDNAASKLMNSTSRGASLLEVSVWNGSVHPIYLTVTVTEPTTLNVNSDFVMRHTVTSTTNTNLDCDGVAEPAACDSTRVVDPLYNNYDSPGTSVSLAANQFTLPALVYPVDSTNALGTPLVVCTAPGCSTAANTYEFALPGRDPSILGNSPPKKYLVVVSTGQISQLRPVDTMRPSTEAMVDTTVAGVRISGALGPSAERCLTYVPDPAGGLEDRCTRTGTIQAYRASMSLSISTASDTSMALQTSALPALPPGRPRPDLVTLQAAIPPLYSWSAAEGPLPPTPPLL